jgi:hypothetical protein
MWSTPAPCTLSARGSHVCISTCRGSSSMSVRAARARPDPSPHRGRRRHRAGPTPGLRVRAAASPTYQGGEEVAHILGLLPLGLSPPGLARLGRAVRRGQPEREQARRVGATADGEARLFWRHDRYGTPGRPPLAHRRSVRRAATVLSTASPRPGSTSIGHRLAKSIRTVAETCPAPGLAAMIGIGGQEVQPRYAFCPQIPIMQPPSAASGVTGRPATSGGA